jgi:hypothetical protein
MMRKEHCRKEEQEKGKGKKGRRMWREHEGKKEEK